MYKIKSLTIHYGERCLKAVSLKCDLDPRHDLKHADFTTFICIVVSRFHSAFSVLILERINGHFILILKYYKFFPLILIILFFFL